jgi:hypothetical protein
VLALLLQAFWVFAARDTLPRISDVVMGSLLRSRFDELAAMPPQKQASDLSEMQAMKELRAKTSPAAFFLTFYQRGFAYYAQRQFISDLDPRMLEFYQAADKRSALAVLLRLGIEYVYVPTWSWPTLERSYIKAIVEDSTLAMLVLDKFGYRLYRLKTGSVETRPHQR